jgi:pimeloyl-ACP methyl ester carboxylesterase
MSAEAERELAASARSLIATAGYLRGGAYRRGIHSMTCPVLLLHGARDRVVPRPGVNAACATSGAAGTGRMARASHVKHAAQPGQGALTQRPDRADWQAE